MEDTREEDSKQSEIDSEKENATNTNSPEEDVQNEGLESSVEEPAPENNLKSKLDKVYGENEDIKAKYLRALADLENLRKRSLKDREDAISRTKAQMLGDLLPVLDAFELGMIEAEKTEESESLFAGFSMAVKQMESILQEYGLSKIDPTGNKFDPALHDAMGYENNDKLEEGTVIRSIRKGYMIKDTLLRPASVMVARKEEKPKE
ncbi:MAG: nucleotide exchange factor GrpE [Verrucomicrobiota bacterium]|nr:nucleotide exchange factor GrpE [Verrucomicrobiota bacterium]